MSLTAAVAVALTSLFGVTIAIDHAEHSDAYDRGSDAQRFYDAILTSCVILLSVLLISAGLFPALALLAAVLGGVLFLFLAFVTGALLDQLAPIVRLG